MKKLFLPLFIALTLSFTFAACSSKSEIKLSGAGATFPYPIYSKWFSDFNKANSNIKINYQSIGSGGGIQQLKAKTVDFAASDAPLNEEEEKAINQTVFHIPSVAGSVVLAYNLPEVKQELKLNAEVLSDIALGKIKEWNNPKLIALNPEAKLPPLPIAWVYRSDGSGTTYIFTDYLTKVSPSFSTQVGKGKAVSWPNGIGAKGNEGVSTQIKTTPGSIGYIEFAYAEKNKISYASLQNKEGEFVKPSLEATTAAAEAMADELQKNIKTSITNAPGKNTYPLSSLTFILVYEKLGDKNKSEALKKLLEWTMTEGQKTASSLLYAPLPEKMIQANLDKINSIATQ